MIDIKGIKALQTINYAFSKVTEIPFEQNNDLFDRHV